MYMESQFPRSREVAQQTTVPKNKFDRKRRCVLWHRISRSKSNMLIVLSQETRDFLVKIFAQHCHWHLLYGTASASETRLEAQEVQSKMYLIHSLFACVLSCISQGHPLALITSNSLPHKMKLRISSYSILFIEADIALNIRPQKSNLFSSIALPSELCNRKKARRPRSGTNRPKLICEWYKNASYKLRSSLRSGVQKMQVLLQ